MCRRLCEECPSLVTPVCTRLKSMRMHRQLFNVMSTLGNTILFTPDVHISVYKVCTVCTSVDTPVCARVKVFIINVLARKPQFVHHRSPCARLGDSVMYLITRKYQFMQIWEPFSCSVQCVLLVQGMKLQFKYFWSPWTYKEYFVRNLYTKKHQLMLLHDMYACVEGFVKYILT